MPNARFLYLKFSTSCLCPETVDAIKRSMFDADADADIGSEMSDENLVDFDILKLLLKPRQVPIPCLIKYCRGL